MSNILKRIFNACDPNIPASAAFYMDLSKVRGGGALTRKVRSKLDLVDEGKYERFLFTGHIGSGKSSEIQHLRDTLDAPEGGGLAYFPILLDAHEYLDDYDVTPADILLAIVTEVAVTLRERLGYEIRDGYFAKRWRELCGVLGSDWEFTEAEVSLGGAKAKVRDLKKDPTARQRVREHLMPRMSGILDELNLVLHEARLAVRNRTNGAGGHRYADLVLLLDNLEKIQRLEGPEKTLETQRDLFLEGYTQLTALEAHVLYTVPLRLVRSAYGPQLQQHYGSPIVLPMVKVIHRDREPCKEGLECLTALVQRRLGTTPLTEAIAPDALELLLRYSGGHVRNLMTFIREACTQGATPIDLDAAYHALEPTLRGYATSIPEAHWPLLAKLESSPDQEIDNGSPDYVLMLENLSVLEYTNGHGSAGRFANWEPWYAVNPLVRECHKFKSAVQVLSEATEDASGEE